MSVRYGVSLVLEPAFSAGLHRARQVTCSQYGCWAAEMHSVHLPLSGYFTCPDDLARTVDDALAEAAGDFRRQFPGVGLERRGIVAEAGPAGSLCLEFSDAGNPLSGGSGDRPQALRRLREAVGQGLARFALPGPGEDPIRFALLQHAPLPESVFHSAAHFAEGVVNGLELPRYGALAELVLLRYQSEAAGEDWRGGGWAADLSWQFIGCHPLAARPVEN